MASPWPSHGPAMASMAWPRPGHGLVWGDFLVEFFFEKICTPFVHHPRKVCTRFWNICTRSAQTASVRVREPRTMVLDHGPKPWSKTQGHGPGPWSSTMVLYHCPGPWTRTMVLDVVLKHGPGT